MKKEIKTPDEFVIYAEMLAVQRIENGMRGNLKIFEDIRNGKKKFSDRTIGFLVDNYNKHLRMLVGDDDFLFDKYRYFYEDGCLDGPILEDDRKPYK